MSSRPSEANDVMNIEIAGDMLFGDVRERPPVRDHRRYPVPGDPPEPHAQWNELSGQWERWDEASQTWVLIDGSASPS
jgi:hypothetical protein